MHILDQIFKIENPALTNKISEEVYDLMLDWFNASRMDIAVFEKDSFEPTFSFFKGLDRNQQYFETHFEVARRNYYLKLAFRYLIYHYPNHELLRRLFQLKKNDSLLSEITGHLDARLSIKYPDVARQYKIGGQLAKYFHAIHSRVNANFSYLPCGFGSLKFNDDPELFPVLFNYVNEQNFEEKPYMLFHLQTSTSLSYREMPDGSLEKEIITASPYDLLIETAFIRTLEEYNQHYDGRLNTEMFHVLNKLKLVLSEVKRGTLTMKNFPEAINLLKEFEGQEMLFLEHMSYFLKNEYIANTSKQWAVVLDEICARCNCTKEGFKRFLEISSRDKKNTNDQLLFKHIITPLFQQLVPQLDYEEPLVQDYQSLLWRSTELIPFEPGLMALRTIASKIENKDIRILMLQRLSPFIYHQGGFNFSHLNYADNDKSFTTIKRFVADLNLLVRVKLKMVNKITYRDNEDDGSIILATEDGKEIILSRYHFVSEVNLLLGDVASPYRLVAIPTAIVHLGHSQHKCILFALSFMNQKEHAFFTKHILTGDRMSEWYIESLYSKYSSFIIDLQYSKVLNPEFTLSTDTSFEELRASQPPTSFGTDAESFFASDPDWTWFKNQYIDQLRSKDSWYTLMDVICQCPKGRKPSAAWIQSIKNAVESFGPEKYFKELQVLFSLSLHEEAWFFDYYANALKGLIWSCAYAHPNEVAVGVLKTIAEHCYTKVRGVGAKSILVGNLALESLVATQMEEAFGVLNLMRNKTRYTTFAQALEKHIDKFKESSSIPQELLADKSIPGFGFEHGKKVYPVGSYFLTISLLGQNLLKEWHNNENETIKMIPDDTALEYEIDLKEINTEIKQITSLFKDLKKRVRTYWLYNRIWKYSDWALYITGHDLLYLHIENLVWTNTTKNKDFILRHHQLYTVHNAPFHPDTDDAIILWHPVLNDEENIGEWQDYLWNHQIVQHERQVFRENYPFSTSELALTETPRFAHHFLEVKKLMAIANNAGWIFTYEHEGLNWPRVYIKPLQITAHLLVDYDRTSYAVPTKNLYFTKGDSTKINDHRQKVQFEKIPLSEIPGIVLSEICRDVDLFISTSSIAHDVELSDNRQEYLSYRTAYESGLFPENANALIRRSIIEKMAPLLKFGDIAFEGNFVIMHGKTKSFRINLNSGFAQILDTLQHINLIPDIRKLKSNKKLRLPIEDDETLYIILAKMIHLHTNEITV